MKALIKQLILEFHHEKVPLPVSRQIAFINLPKDIRKANVFVGMRRSGKTWLMYQHMHQALARHLALQKSTTR